MNVLGIPLEESDVEAIQKQYPDFDGTVPPEAWYWTEAELEAFFSSRGKVRPREVAETSSPAQTCALLSKARLLLAQLRVVAPSSEYLAYCRHVRERRNPCKLPDLATCGPVRRLKVCPESLQVPCTLTRGNEPKELRWGLDFLAQTFWGHTAVARTRTPAFERDAGVDAVALETTIWNYVEYARLLNKADPGCLEENALCFPRVQIEGWSPFADGLGRSAFDELWRELSPPGVPDLTARWAELIASDGEDWVATLSRFYEFSISAPGAVTRLHAENSGAHTWFTQVEGQRIFFVFSPQEAAKLGEERGSFVDTPGGYAARVSVADVFFAGGTREKQPTALREVNGHVAFLNVGDTLVLPAGWWYTAIATEPSVTLRHRFWSMDNRLQIIEELWAPYNRDEVSMEVREEHRERFRELRELIKAADDERDVKPATS